MSPADRIPSLVEAFQAQFGRAPDGIWASPGRVNLIGEHTDHQGGLALPFAIDRFVWIAGARRDDGVLRAASAQHPGESVEMAADHPPTATGWGAYPLGVGYVLRDEGLTAVGADLWIDSTVPAGSGLSSSAALTCATALTLLGLAGADVPRDRVAHVAQRAETDVVGAPVGLLDQTAVLFAEGGAALLIDFEQPSPTHTPVALPGDPWRLTVIDTGVRHSHASGGYADRRAVLDRARQELGVASLSSLDAPRLRDRRAELGDPEYHAAHHVVSENARVLETVSALARHDIAEVGALLVRSHESLRDDLRVSCSELDLAVSEAIAAGAAGARMTGGGFGGSVVVLADATVTGELPARVRGAFAAASLASPEVRVVRAVSAAGRVGKG